MADAELSGAPPRKRQRLSSLRTKQLLAEHGAPVEAEDTDAAEGLSLQELQDADFSWTIVRGHVYAIGDFIPHHPGGPLIWRCVGEDATELFEAHHASRSAQAVLHTLKVGCIRPDGGKTNKAGRESLDECCLRAELNRRMASFLEVPALPEAEAVALMMLVLFSIWTTLAYMNGWMMLNVALSWFWARHLDAGLHSAVHGDFKYSRVVHRCLLQTYSVLCHHMLDYYQGSSHGVGLSQHFQHHLYTNDVARDPDMADFAGGRNWVRRHPCNPWHEYHEWQCIYWLAVLCVLEPVSETLTMVAACVMGTLQLLEPPVDRALFKLRLKDVASWWAEALLNPEYQGAAFFFQPWWQALGSLLLSKAVAKLVLLPFADVQHFLVPDVTEDCVLHEEFVVTQLRTTANLKLHNPLAQLLDFLMFHGDSLQVEHHLWPAMSFVRLRAAAKVLRKACADLGLPYQEVGYWEAYSQVWQQVRQHAAQPHT